MKRQKTNYKVIACHFVGDPRVYTIEEIAEKFREARIKKLNLK